MRAQLPGALPVDHTIPAAAYRDWRGAPLPDLAEPPTTTTLRWLYFGLGKLGWGGVCCLLLTPVNLAARWREVALTWWLQAPVETVPQLLFRLLPPLWCIADHLMPAYTSMYYSPVT